MQSNIPDNRIHDGHRSRMKAKLICHGQRIFDTYELLEMLLYYTVPYKDTNPISKHLLSAFGDLDGVLGADKEELVRVNGVGEKTAELLRLVGVLADVIGNELIPYNKSIFSDYNDAGGFFTDYFKGETEKRVVAAYLNNNFDLISIETIARGIDFESGAIQPKLFIDGAIKHRASVVVTAHNHPFGSPYPSEGDRASNTMLADALAGINVAALEHYVISGEKFIGIGDKFVSNFCQSPYIEGFIKSRDECENALSVSEKTLKRLDNCYNRDDLDYFTSLMSYAAKGNSESALKLLKRFHTIEGVFSASADELRGYVGDCAAVYVKLISFITSRRKTDLFPFGRKYTSKELAEYLKALYIGVSEETVYMLCFDSKHRLAACELVSVGTVNSSDVLPRRILELALKYSSKKIAIAHNHPGGNTDASSEDMAFTARLAGVLANSDIEMLSHYIVAGQQCIALSCASVRTEKL